MNGFAPNTQLYGRYGILEQIGKGGFGIVCHTCDNLD
jgi:hypothetical protein